MNVGACQMQHWLWWAFADQERIKRGTSWKPSQKKIIMGTGEVQLGPHFFYKKYFLPTPQKILKESSPIPSCFLCFYEATAIFLAWESPSFSACVVRFKTPPISEKKRWRKLPSFLIFLVQWKKAIFSFFDLCTITTEHKHVYSLFS